MRLVAGAKGFFVSSCLFVIAAVVQLFLDTLYPIPFEVLTPYRSGQLPTITGLVLFVVVGVGLISFIIGVIQAVRSKSQE